MSLQAPVATVAHLPGVFEPLRRELAAIVEAWMDAGASAVALVHGARRCTIAGTVLHETGPTLSAPIPLAGHEWVLEVTGVRAGHSQRLHLDAELIGRLATREVELRELTDSLLAANDQLVAVHDLARTTLGALTPEAIVGSISTEALRLTGAAAVCLSVVGQEPVTVGVRSYRRELESFARTWRGSNMEVLAAAATGVAAEIVICPVGNVEGQALVVIGHADQRFDRGTAQVVDAIAQRAQAHLELAAIHSRETDALLRDHTDLTRRALAAAVPDLLPAPPGVTVSGRREDATATSFMLGVPHDAGAVFAFGTVSGPGLSGAVGTVALAAAALGALHSDRERGVPAVLERMLNNSLGSVAGHQVTVGCTVIGWRSPSGPLELASVGPMLAAVRHRGRGEPLTVGDDTLGAITRHHVDLQPGDALVVATAQVVEQPDALGRPLGCGALVAAMSDRFDRPAAELVAHLQALGERHQGPAPSLPDRALLAIVRDR